MLKRFWFNKKIYPIFLKQIDAQLGKSKFLVEFVNDKDEFKIYLVINRNFFIMSKHKEKPIDIEQIILPDVIHYDYCFVSNKGIEHPEFFEIVKNMKTNASIIDSQHIIDAIHNAMKNSIGYYHFSSQDIRLIYQHLLSFGKKLFSNNPQAVIMDEVHNRWID